MDKYNNFYFKQNNIQINIWNPAIALLLRFNYNIAFANNTFILIYYITNYATKKNTSKYQRIMDAIFVKNAYNQS